MDNSERGGHLLNASFIRRRELGPLVMRYEDSPQVVTPDKMHVPAKCNAEKDKSGEIVDLSDCPKMGNRPQ